METQNYANHRRYMPAFHFVLIPLVLLTFIGSAINLYKSLGDHERLYSASLIFVLTVCVGLAALLARIFALKAQDRAIRAEQNLRHFALTGKLLDARVTMSQAIALRFASDAEFLNLARRAADEGVSGDELKRAIKDWRADTFRV